MSWGVDVCNKALARAMFSENFPRAGLNWRQAMRMLGEDYSRQRLG